MELPCVPVLVALPHLDFSGILLSEWHKALPVARYINLILLGPTFLLVMTQCTHTMERENTAKVKLKVWFFVTSLRLPATGHVLIVTGQWADVICPAAIPVTRSFKMSVQYDTFLNSEGEWFLHVVWITGVHIQSTVVILGYSWCLYFMSFYNTFVFENWWLNLLG